MSGDTAGTLSSWSGRLMEWAGQVRLARKLAIALTVAAMASGVATYVALTGSAPFDPDPTTVLVLLTVDLVLLLLLGAVVARRIVQVWAERRRGAAGSRLHIRLVVMFSLVAVTPAIFVAVFSALFFNLGIESWFNERVRTALEESVAVAESYLDEHQQVIRADVLAMANDLNRSGPALLQNPKRFSKFVATQTVVRSLEEAIVFDGSGRLLARSMVSFVLEFDPIPSWALENARNGEVVLLVNENDDRVRALVRLDRFVDTFLYVGRFVDSKVLGHMERTQGAVREYEQLEQRRSGLQITFALIFVVVALLWLLAAVWVGLLLANQLARPISGLIAAAERVRAGNLTARVAEGPASDELGTLSRAFNRMTSQLESQRREVVEAHRQIDTRRRFIEAVLSGVSAGVIGLDPDGRINYPNSSASQLLSTDLHSLIGTNLADAVPEMAGPLKAARKKPNRLVESQIELVRRGRSHTLLVRIAVERDDREIKGFVVTFDDITELLSAQRKATWADVARRLAHEIKNPLTPIQLSAERLRRKYLGEVRGDSATFSRCIDTIIRQVDDIGGMIDEFSAFARMPAPVLKPSDLTEIARRAVFLQQSANPTIEYVSEFPDHEVELSCDGRQIGQALTNLLQNAADSIVARADPPGAELHRGEVRVSIAEGDERATITVEDNGAGLPRESRASLTDPYVTTRAEGTGLGLAIVRKIMEDHGGELVLEDRKGGGARVILLFNTAQSGSMQENSMQEKEKSSEDDPPVRKTAVHDS